MQIIENGPANGDELITQRCLRGMRVCKLVNTGVALDSWWRGIELKLYSACSILQIE